MFKREASTLVTEQTPSTNRAMRKKVNELELSLLTINCLQNDGIMRIGDLVQKTEDEILRVPGFGRKRLREVKEELARMGLHLGMEVPGWPPVTIKDLFPPPRRRRMRSP
jgi:DNA-directed RNA polymerase subunit alpha